MHLKVFISYSWENEELIEWVNSFVNELRNNGYDAISDKFITQIHTIDLNEMMVKYIQDSDYILVIMTESYAKKSNDFKGGVGTETRLIMNIIKDYPDKIIPILKSGDSKNSVPAFLKSYNYLNFSDNTMFNEKFKELLHRLSKTELIKLEPIGVTPKLSSNKTKRLTKDIIINGTSNMNDSYPRIMAVINNNELDFNFENFGEFNRSLVFDIAFNLKSISNIPVMNICYLKSRYSFSGKNNAVRLFIPNKIKSINLQENEIVEFNAYMDYDPAFNYEDRSETTEKFKSSHYFTFNNIFGSMFLIKVTYNIDFHFKGINCTNGYHFENDYKYNFMTDNGEIIYYTIFITSKIIVDFAEIERIKSDLND